MDNSMAIFNENGGLVSTGGAAIVNRFGSYDNFSKLNSIIEGLYWETKGQSEYLESICEAGIADKWASFKNWVSGVIRKIVEGWNTLIDSLSTFVNRVSFKGKDQQIIKAYHTYTSKNASLEFKGKNKEKLDDYFKRYIQLPEKSVAEIVEFTQKASDAFKTKFANEKESGGSDESYAAAIGSAINLNISNADYKAVIDEFFKVGEKKTSTFSNEKLTADIKEIIKTAQDPNKSITSCRNISKSISKMEKEIISIAKKYEAEPSSVRKSTFGSEAGDEDSSTETGSESNKRRIDTMGAKTGIMMITYINTNAMRFARDKISLAAKICAILAHTKGGAEYDDSASANSDDNFAKNPGDYDDDDE